MCRALPPAASRLKVKRSGLSTSQHVLPAHPSCLTSNYLCARTMPVPKCRAGCSGCNSSPHRKNHATVIVWLSPSRHANLHQAEVVSAEPLKPSCCPCTALMASWLFSLPTVSFTLWIALELTFHFPTEQFYLCCFFFLLALTSKICCEHNLGACSQIHNGLIS